MLKTICWFLYLILQIVCKYSAWWKTRADSKNSGNHILCECRQCKMVNYSMAPYWNEIPEAVIFGWSSGENDWNDTHEVACYGSTYSMTFRGLYTFSFTWPSCQLCKLQYLSLRRYRHDPWPWMRNYETHVLCFLNH